MQCPSCDRSLRVGVKSCSCGWSAPDKPRSSAAPALDPDRGRCAWMVDTARCCYPGTTSHDTHGGGAWYCRFHFNCGDPITGMRIIEQSQSVSYVGERNEAASPVVVSTAWDIAKRHGNKPWRTPDERFPEAA